MDLDYEQIGNILDSGQMARVIYMIQKSKKIRIADELPDGRLSHIVIEGTTTPIGYVGDDTLEIVNPKDKSLRKYHNILSEIYEKVARIKAA